MSSLNLNFKGIAIGNGWVDPYNQYPAYAEFAYENNLISKDWYETLQTGFKACQKMIDLGDNFVALEMCQLLTETVLGNPLHPKFNVYDIRIPCEVAPLCYDFSNAGVYLNEPEVQAQLGVSGRKWKDCKTDVHLFLMGDWLYDLNTKVTDLLESGL